MSQGRTRARLLPLLACSLLSIAAVGAVASASTPAAGVGFAAIVTWPPSTDLLIGEVVTGGAGANDEYVEIYNAGSLPADLGGLELVYVTASGSTVTRKATWTSRVMSLLAVTCWWRTARACSRRSRTTCTAAGWRQPAARLRCGWSAGRSSTRSAGECHEQVRGGTVAPAPPAGQSLERLPGGSSGNRRDTNDNLTDTWVQPLPVPQSLASPAVPRPTPSPSGDAEPHQGRGACRRRARSRSHAQHRRAHSPSRPDTRSTQSRPTRAERQAHRPRRRQPRTPSPSPPEPTAHAEPGPTPTPSVSPAPTPTPEPTPTPSGQPDASRHRRP